MTVDPAADDRAMPHLMRVFSGENHSNFGTGADVTIAKLADMVAILVGFDGQLEFDSSKPDGAPRKLLNVSYRQALGWAARTILEEGLQRTHRWLREYSEGR